MIIGRFYLGEGLGLKKELHELLDFLLKRSPIPLIEGSSHDQLNGEGSKIDIDSLVNVLISYPKYTGGDIYLKGDDYSFLIELNVRFNDINTIQFFIAEQFFEERERLESLIGFLEFFCVKFPVLFGGLAREEEWHYKKRRSYSNQCVHKKNNQSRLGP